MIKQLLLLSTLFITSAFANTSYNSDTANSIESIYWLNNTQDGAIIYANHHGFRQLKNFIDTTILTSEQATNKQFNFKTSEQLLLMQPSAKNGLRYICLKINYFLMIIFMCLKPMLAMNFCK